MSTRLSDERKSGTLVIARRTSNHYCWFVVTVVVSVLGVLVVGGCTQPKRVQVEASLLPPASKSLPSELTHAANLDSSQLRALTHERAELCLVLSSAARGFEGLNVRAHCVEAARVRLHAIATSSVDDEMFRARCAEEFVVARVDDGAVHCTGYATVELSAARSRSASFRFPIFGDLRKSAPELLQRDRAEALADPRVDALAIAWMPDAFSWALVETNGTALLRFEDGTSLAISRVATNGRPWKSLSRGMKELGALSPQASTLAELEGAAALRPDLAETAALSNPRFVSFEVRAIDRFPPAIPDGTLRANMSCAADPSSFPLGSMLFVGPRSAFGSAPEMQWRCVQDTGGAIGGSRRIDLYCGIGADALRVAGEINIEARVSLLLLRASLDGLGLSSP